MERIGLSFSGGLQPTDIVDCVQLADELGYESAWMAEGHGGDQFSILTACALKTKNILLGTSITSVFVRSAPTIAMAAASVDHFSGGRFVLGLGTSHKVQVEPEHGLVFEKPIPRMRECVAIIRELLRNGRSEPAGARKKIGYLVAMRRRQRRRGSHGGAPDQQVCGPIPPVPQADGAGRLHRGAPGSASALERGQH